MREAKKAELDGEDEDDDSYFYIINHLMICLYLEDQDELPPLNESDAKKMLEQIQQNFK
jgi:hypothetical protein